MPQPNNDTANWFSENLLANEMKKEKVKINKPVYIGLSIIEISKILMYKFWDDYMKPKYGDSVKLCDSSIKILQMMLKKDLIHQIMKLIGHCLHERIKTLSD